MKNLALALPFLFFSALASSNELSCASSIDINESFNSKVNINNIEDCNFDLSDTYEFEMLLNSELPSPSSSYCYYGFYGVGINDNVSLPTLIDELRNTHFTGSKWTDTQILDLVSWSLEQGAKVYLGRADCAFSDETPVKILSDDGSIMMDFIITHWSE